MFNHFALGDEVDQIFLPGRAFELSDLFLDISGVLLALFLWWLSMLIFSSVKKQKHFPKNKSSESAFLFVFEMSKLERKDLNPFFSEKALNLFVIEKTLHPFVSEKGLKHLPLPVLVFYNSVEASAFGIDIPPA